MGVVYTIQDTKPNTYFDEGGKVITGYTIYFIIHEFGEGHNVDVPNITDLEYIDKRITEVVDARVKASQLGG